MFDTTIQPMDMGIAVSDDPNAEQIQLIVVVGMVLPFQQAPGQPPMMVPVGNVRIPVDRESGLKLAQELTEECEKLKKPSDLVTASDLQSVKRMAEATARLK